MILAGGAGTRLWPLSRSTTPKHLLRLTGDSTLLRGAYERARLVAERVMVVTEASQLEACRAELPELDGQDFIAEPGRRGTAGCLALAARALDPGDTMISLHADHLVPDAEAFAATARDALAWAAETGSLVTLGLRPTHPATGFGYIQCGEEVAAAGRRPARRVLRFVEKPPRDEAERMVAAGDYLWNLGIFAWRNGRFLEELEKGAPEIATGAAAAAAARAEGRDDAYREAYLALPELAVDHAVMERSLDQLVVPASFAWSDLGSWTDLAAVLPNDPSGNAVRGDLLDLDSRDNIVVGGRRLVALLGVEDMVVVDADDALLIVPRARVQEVKEIVAELRRRGRGDLA